MSDKQIDIEVLDKNMAVQGAGDRLSWHDVRGFTVEGKGWDDTKGFFDRFPSRAEGVVRDPVWRFSQNSAGILVRFETDATEISARWTLMFDRVSMVHMPATGVSGLDLYLKDPAIGWRWVGVGKPNKFPEVAANLVSDLEATFKEYMLYLPLYNGVKSLEIGVNTNAVVRSSPPRTNKPIVFYGTSVTQGGCASRPGMVYTAILGRRLDVPVINLGFSGNGRMEPEIGDLLAELDPCIYVIDSLGNMTEAEVVERMELFIQKLYQVHPNTPIVFLENRSSENRPYRPRIKEIELSKNIASKEAYNNLIAGGLSELYYIPDDMRFQADREGTVDGRHATDLGYMRIADYLEPIFKKILDKKDHTS